MHAAQKQSLPPLWHETFLFTELIERAVKQFPRYYKYTLGQDLRHQSSLLPTIWHCVLAKYALSKLDI